MASPAAAATIEAAFHRLENTLTPKDRSLLQSTTLEDVRKAAIDIQNSQRGERRMQNLRRIDPLLKGIQRFSKPLEVLCNGTPYLPWIWAPIKLVLQIASEYSAGLEKIIHAYADIAQSLPRLDRYQHMFQHDDFQNALATIYSTILEFHTKVYRFIRQRAWKILFDSSWKSFEIRFSDILDRLTKCRSFIDQEATSFDMLESFRLRKLIEEDIEKRERERAGAIFQEVLAWLDADWRTQDRQLENLTERKYGGTCEWILKHPSYMNWDREQGSSSPYLWIWGIPGSGKSILASHIIGNLRTTKPNHATLHYFCRFSDVSRDEYGHILRCLTLQLVRKNEALLLHVADNYVRKGVSSSSDQIKNLMLDILPTIQSPRMIIDGLDECSLKEQRNIPMKLISLCEALGGTCKLLILSRDNTPIEKVLRKRPTISLREEQQALHGDIESFTRKRLLGVRFDWPFDISDPQAQSIEQSLLKGAKGMFLWVELVIASLEWQFSVDDLFATLSRLPEDLQSAYERIFTKMMETPDLTARRRITAILQWLAYGKRSLQAREIASAVAIDPDLPQLTYEPRYLSDEVVKLCKPIIDVSSAGVVDFVHFSAKEYLVSSHTKFHLRPLDAHLTIAKSSLLYLGTTTSFLEPERSIQVRREILVGARNVHRYVMDFWLDHVLRIAEITTDAGSKVDSFLVKHLRSILWIRRETSLRATPDVIETFATFVDPEVQQFLLDILTYRTTYPNLERRCPSAEALQHAKLESDPTHLSNIDRSYDICMQQIMEATPNDPMHDEAEQKLILEFQQWHGGAALPCRYLDCKLSGPHFRTEAERLSHEKVHIKSFKCPVPYCLRENEGFKKQTELDRHCRTSHAEFEEQQFPRLVTSFRGNKTVGKQLSDSATRHGLIPEGSHTATSQTEGSSRSAIDVWTPSLVVGPVGPGGDYLKIARTRADGKRSVDRSSAGQESVDLYQSTSDTGHEVYAYKDLEHESHYQSVFTGISDPGDPPITLSPPTTSPDLLPPSAVVAASESDDLSDESNSVMNGLYGQTLRGEPVIHGAQLKNEKDSDPNPVDRADEYFDQDEPSPAGRDPGAPRPEPSTPELLIPGDEQRSTSGVLPHATPEQQMSQQHQDAPQTEHIDRYIAQQLQLQGSYTGWQGQFDINERLLIVRRLAYDLAPFQGNSELMKWVQIILSWEEMNFTRSSDQEEYNSTCQQKLTAIRDIRARKYGPSNDHICDEAEYELYGESRGILV